MSFENNLSETVNWQEFQDTVEKMRANLARIDENKKRLAKYVAQLESADAHHILKYGQNPDPEWHNIDRVCPTCGGKEKMEVCCQTDIFRDGRIMVTAHYRHRHRNCGCLFVERREMTMDSAFALTGGNGFKHTVRCISKILASKEPEQAEP